MREKLEHCKIYFETLVMAAMTLMSLIVSIIGLRIDHRNQVISQKELEILTNERAPYFQFLTEDEPILTNNVFNDIYEIHKIVNMGGAVSGASLRADLVIIAALYVGDEPIVYGFIPSMISTPNKGIYDAEARSFTFFERRAGLGEEYNGVDEHFLADLKTDLVDALGLGVLFSKAYRVQINYIDYKNEQHCVSYLFRDNGFFVEDDAEIYPDYYVFQTENSHIIYPGSSQVDCYYAIQSSNVEIIKEEIKEIILENMTDFFSSPHQEEDSDPQDIEIDE